MPYIYKCLNIKLPASICSQNNLHTLKTAQHKQRTHTNSWKSMLWSRAVARHSETRLRIRIIPSVRFDLIISNQHLITLKQTAVEYPRINIQPDFVGVIVGNVERSSFDCVSAFIAVWIRPAYRVFCSRFYFVKTVVFECEFLMDFRLGLVSYNLWDKI